MALFRTLVGYREDLDLTARWWHRLLKVVYVVLVFSVAAIGTYAAFEAEPDRNISNVRVTGNLGDVLVNADARVPNVVPAFVLLPGELGLVEADGNIGYVFDSNMSDSWCTPGAVRHLRETTTFLKDHRIGFNGNETTVLKSIQDASSELDPRLCWIDPYLRNAAVDHIVKFQFTRSALMGKRVEVMAWVGFGLLISTLVTCTFYYRGLVYIICGPRNKRQPQASSAGVARSVSPD